jgi:hypothetical protein
MAWLVLALSLKTPVVLARDSQIPIIDGVINEGEYTRHTFEPSTNIDIYWYNDEVYLNTGLRSPGLGWVAIAFEPNAPFHKGANIIIGYVKNDQLFIEDHYGTASTSHNSDVALGGTNNILESAGNESEGKTTIEFKIPLNSGDLLDTVLEPNTDFTVMVAYQATADDLTSIHTAAGIVSITTIPELPTIPLLLLCLGLSLVSVLLRKWHGSQTVTKEKA